ncbi:hypothetical protein [Magnetofaba australis]|uniref:Uncharacterized protein n=1 Tax=Magnetofaba australis IT-1 TaxID=1434232 RepID=A0A1Y2K1U2_9PROT|nr:hypothetical protein [Magnetofaba australis]OSM01973.1 hypothetical protein MAIT1_02040 [Magnetofaba australis IT-1]
MTLRLLGFIAAVTLWFATPLPAQAADDAKASNAPAPDMTAPNRPVAILVDGYGDCCAHEMHELIDGLKAAGVEFPAVALRGLSGRAYTDYSAPWNALTARDQGFKVTLNPNDYIAKPLQSGMDAFTSLLNMQNIQAVLNGDMNAVMGQMRKGSDERFLRETSQYLFNLPPERRVILIGHSFGGDSVAKLLSLTGRPILFAAVLDPVGGAGLRSAITGRGVPGNVRYFYNRWQTQEAFPFDYASDGAFTPCGAQQCDQRSVGAVHHDAVPRNTQQEMLAIIRDLLAGRTPNAKGQNAKSAKGGKDGLLQRGVDLLKLFGQ